MSLHIPTAQPSLFPYTKFRQAFTYTQHIAFTSGIHKVQTSLHIPAAQSHHFSHTQSSDKPAHTSSTKPSLLAYTKFRQACTYTQHIAFTSRIHKVQTGLHIHAAHSLHFSHTQSSYKPAHTRSTKSSLFAYTKFRRACTYLQHKAITSRIHKVQTGLHIQAAQSLHFLHTQSSDRPAHTGSTKSSLFAYTKFRQACTYRQHKVFTFRIHKVQTCLHIPAAQPSLFTYTKFRRAYTYPQHSLHFSHTHSLDKPAHTRSTKPSLLAFTKFRQACTYPQHSLHFSPTQSSDEPAHTRSTAFTFRIHIV